MPISGDRSRSRRRLPFEIEDPAYNVPRAKGTNYSQKLGAASKPVLIIPENQRRVYFILGNASGSTVFFSFGYPLNIAQGIPLATGNYFQMQGSALLTDDIFVFAASASLFVSAWEGVPLLRVVTT